MKTPSDIPARRLAVHVRRLAVATLAIWATMNQLVAAAEPTITVDVSSTSVQVAEPFTFEMTVIADAEDKVLFPAVPQKLGKFDVVDRIDRFDIPLAAENARRRWTRRLTLESIETGEQPIPEIEVQIATQDGDSTLTSNLVLIRVKSVLEDRADPTKFRDLQPLLDVAEPLDRSLTWLWWSLGALAATAVLVAAIVGAMRRKHSISAAEWATHRLEELESSFSSTNLDTTTAIHELSTIIRDYLELQYGMTASTLTTEELIQTLHANAAVDEEMTRRCRELFTLADQAKYAGLNLDDDELRRQIGESRRLIASAHRSQPDSAPTLTDGGELPMGT